MLYNLGHITLVLYNIEGLLYYKLCFEMKMTKLEVGHFTSISGQKAFTKLRFWLLFWRAQYVKILIGSKAAT